MDIKAWIIGLKNSCSYFTPIKNRSMQADISINNSIDEVSIIPSQQLGQATLLPLSIVLSPNPTNNQPALAAPFLPQKKEELMDNE